MNDFNDELNRRVQWLREQNLFRELRRVDSPQSPRIEIGGRRLLNFGSNDYLGLANEPEIKQAAIEAAERYGTGAGASPLICGRLAPHAELEETLAAFKGVAGALCFSSGYAAAVGTIGALMGRNDVVVLDRLVHASIVDAARLSGAKLRVFPHNDLDALSKILKWIDQRPAGALTSMVRRPRTLIATESVFSMDGDHAPLRELVSLKDKAGAWLLVDEAHATGLYGANRRGWAEECGVADQIEIQMGTLGKSLGAAGGYICGTRPLIDYLANRARSFVFSTAPVPACAGAASAGVRFVQAARGEERRRQLWERVDQFSPRTRRSSAIIPVLLGTEERALTVASNVYADGIFVPAIRYPTVARGKARLRITLSAAHSIADVAQLIAALEKENLPTRIPG